MTAHKNPQRAVRAIIGAFTRRLSHAEHTLAAVEAAIDAAGRATQLAYREQRISVEDAFLRIPEGMGFALTQQLRNTEGVSPLAMLRLIRLGREVCGVDAEVFTGELPQRQAA